MKYVKRLETKLDFWLSYYDIYMKLTLLLKGEASGNGWETNGNGWVTNGNE